MFKRPLKAVLTASVLAAALLGGCGTTPASKGIPGSSSSAPASAIQIDPDVPPPVAQALVNSLHTYLDPYLAADKPDDQRIRQYMITRISVAIDTKDGRVYAVRYSILPANAKSVFWMAGNGVVKDGDPWIRDKTQMVKASMEGDKVKVESGLP